MRAIMLDTQGPEIRTGSFAEGVKEVELVTGDTVELTTEESVRTSQTASRLWISYAKLLETVQEGSRVLLDDGAVEVMVQSKDLGKNTVSCKVMNSGTLGNKKGKRGEVD
jgi:pyruvate kinase